MDFAASDVSPTTPIASTVPVSHQVSLAGLCSVESRPDVACVAGEISRDHIVVGCRTDVAVADKVIFSFPEFGLLEAVVVETFEDSFAATFEPCAESKLGLYLAWLDGGPESAASPADRRAFERITPVHRLTTLKTAHDPENMARVIDLSRSSVSFTTSKELEAGEPVALGLLLGKVVRVFEGGAAVAFDRPIGEDDFGPMIDLRPAEG